MGENNKINFENAAGYPSVPHVGSRGACAASRRSCPAAMEAHDGLTFPLKKRDSSMCHSGTCLCSSVSLQASGASSKHLCVYTNAGLDSLSNLENSLETVE